MRNESAVVIGQSQETYYFTDSGRLPRFLQSSNSFFPIPFSERRMPIKTILSTLNRHLLALSVKACCLRRSLVL